jgi:hypothetical protein
MASDNCGSFEDDEIQSIFNAPPAKLETTK